jgi:hypothetical protein
LGDDYFWYDAIMNNLDLTGTYPLSTGSWLNGFISSSVFGNCPGSTPQPTTTPTITPTKLPSMCFEYWDTWFSGETSVKIKQSITASGYYGGRPYWVLPLTNYGPSQQAYVFWSTMNNNWSATAEYPGYLTPECYLIIINGFLNPPALPYSDNINYRWSENGQIMVSSSVGVCT